MSLQWLRVSFSLLFPLNNMFEKLIYDVYIWRGNIVYGIDDGGRVSIKRITLLRILNIFII